MLALALVGCTRDPDHRPRPEPTTPTDAPTGDTGGGSTLRTPTAHTGDTGPTTTLPTDPCAALSDTPLSIDELPIETTEDFDFDALGRLVYADWNGNMVATDGLSRPEVFSPGSWDTDARGIQVMSDGAIAVNYIGGGRIVRVDPATGERSDLVVGVNGPNALEVGAGDILYFSETYPGRVNRFDPGTGDLLTIATGFTYPNGLAFAPDELTLYISDDARGIYAITRTDPTSDDWTDPVRVFDPAPGEAYDAMETDICGNLYSVQFYSGKVFRYSPATDTAVLIRDLNDTRGLLWNAIRWGSDRGVWRRDTLYVTSRNTVFALELGVAGRAQPVDLLP